MHKSFILSLAAPLAGLVLLGAGVGAQARDFGHHDHSTVNVRDHLPMRHSSQYHRRDGYRGDYGHNRYRGDHRHRDSRRYAHDRRYQHQYRGHGEHRRYAHDRRWHRDKRERNFFGRW
ncbi:hypothetical protein V5738_00460 [Salinisphaera sp. SPP-AMP-43]|uniref:hypothetical protein n=1 Tax=Salinisphaera sp. SPP-AMP-43 TaxID=3121288 RepID=UPI003C6E8458